VNETFFVTSQPFRVAFQPFLVLLDAFLVLFQFLLIFHNYVNLSVLLFCWTAHAFNALWLRLLSY